MIERLQFSSESAWLDALVADFQRAAEEAIRERGRFHVALSGGTTPKPFYIRLNQEELPWDRIEWWLGDERWVPPSQPESNEGMVLETLGASHAGFRDHFQSWHLAREPALAVLRYEEEMVNRLGTPPVFDLILLGIGSDGHTASLFSGTVALEEKIRYAALSQAPQKISVRLTLTLPTLNAARQVWFLVCGKEKEFVVGEVVQGKTDFPAARIGSRRQKLYWFVSGSS